MKKSFTIRDINQMIDILARDWVLELVYHPETDAYKTAKIKDFDKPATLLVARHGTNHYQFIKVDVNEDKFVYELVGKKHDVSDIWQEVLGKVNQV